MVMAEMDSRQIENNDIPLADDEELSVENSCGTSPRPAQPLPKVADLDDGGDMEEKAALISNIMELQSTLDELSQRVDKVKEESLKLRSENEVLSQYIDNLMAASSIFQPTAQSGRARN